MGQFVHTREFALADLALVVTCGFVGYLWPDKIYWAMLIAFIPRVARLFATRFHFKSTRFAIPLGLFLVTAGVGVWAAYDKHAAWEKSGMILAAFLLFLAYAGQPKENLYPAAGITGGIAAFFTVYFMLVHDWSILPADFDVLNRVGQVWMRVRPDFPVPQVHPNAVGGVLATLFPVWFFYLSHKRNLGSMASILLRLGMTLLIVTGLMMSSSRAAWLSLVLALGIWVLWLGSGMLAKITRVRQGYFFSIVLLIVVLSGFIPALAYPGGLLNLVDRLPGAASGASRVELLQNASRLVLTFFFTGGGLNAFPGLYSRYLLVIPHYFLGYGHNLFLDVALEQGIFALLALAWVLVGSFGLLLVRLFGRGQDTRNISLGWALLASLIVIVLHGLVDDAFYGARGTPFLFIIPGLVVAYTKKETLIETVNANGKASVKGDTVKWKLLGILGLSSVVCLGMVLANEAQRWMLTRWYANLGAASMAKAELYGWPEKNPDATPVEYLDQAEYWLNRSASIHPEYAPAAYRLGIIAMKRMDYATARTHLERAYLLDSSHRGIQKVLGYNYVWMGELDKAFVLLEIIPEAGIELAYYAWFWSTEGYEELSFYASQMVKRLERVTPPE